MKKRLWLLGWAAVVVFAGPAWAVSAHVSTRVGDYVIAGITSAEVETDGGLVAVQAACQAEFGALARICSTVEVVNSPGLTTLEVTQESMVRAVPFAVSMHVTGTNDFVNTATYDVTGVTAGSGSPGQRSAQSWNCRAWTTDSDNHVYAVLAPAGTYGQDTATLGTSQCLNTPAPVVCCVPSP